ncbi:MAG: hypothetical protein AAF533_28570 [Acidobacteriota bacterium]
MLRRLLLLFPLIFLCVGFVAHHVVGWRSEKALHSVWEAWGEQLSRDLSPVLARQEADPEALTVETLFAAAGLDLISSEADRKRPSLEPIPEPPLADRLDQYLATGNIERALPPELAAWLDRRSEPLRALVVALATGPTPSWEWDPEPRPVPPRRLLDAQRRLEAEALLVLHSLRQRELGRATEAEQALAARAKLSGDLLRRPDSASRLASARSLRWLSRLERCAPDLSVPSPESTPEQALRWGRPAFEHESWWLVHLGELEDPFGALPKGSIQAGWKAKLGLKTARPLFRLAIVDSAQRLLDAESMVTADACTSMTELRELLVEAPEWNLTVPSVRRALRAQEPAWSLSAELALTSWVRRLRAGESLPADGVLEGPCPEIRWQGEPTPDGGFVLEPEGEVLTTLVELGLPLRHVERPTTQR